MRDRPKYLPGLSYGLSGGPKSITQRNFEMSQRKPWVIPPCPTCHRVANVTEGKDSYSCSSCGTSFNIDRSR